MELRVRQKSGRNSAAKDRCRITHAVNDSAYPSYAKALCGTKPGYMAMGWDEPEKQGAPVTCSKCLKRLAVKE